MQFEEAEPLKKRPIPEIVKKSRAELIDVVTSSSVQSDLTQDLLLNGPSFIAQAFAEYGIKRSYAPSDTFFIPPENLSAIEASFGDNYQNHDGGYLPALDWILIFLRNELIIDVHTFFHENIHGLGAIGLWVNEDQVVASRVGYSFSIHNEDNMVITRRGDFLEEATVNWLADRATVLYLKARKIKIPKKKPERYVAELVGGRPHSHMRDCLDYLSKGDSELFKLFMQARFDVNLITKLTIALSRLYGTGSMAKLNKLDSGQPFENDVVVMSIRPN